MYVTDLAFVYKERKNLLFAISKNHTKVILKNNFFSSLYLPLETFYVVEYEYIHSFDDDISFTKKNILKINRLSLYHVISLLTIEKDIAFFADILMYVVGDFVSTKDVFLFLYNFFLKKADRLCLSREGMYTFFLRELFFFSHIISTDEYSTLKTFRDVFLRLADFFPKELYRDYDKRFFEV
jgi:hypothetical protein